MARAHPNGNQDLEVDDTAFVEFMQQYDEKNKQNILTDKPQMFAFSS
jgi:hypothetical protein